MASPSENGRGHPIPPRVRIDGRSGGRLPVVLGRAVPGRVFVVSAVVGLLLAWGVLYAVFIGWRAEARRRIAFGKEEVAPVVAELAELEPPGVPSGKWREAVDGTRAMIEEVVGTGRLDLPALGALRDDLASRVASARARPGAAPAILAGIWDDLGRLKRLRAGTDRPEVLPPPVDGRPAAGASP